jgi:lipoprotein NlpI
MKKLLTAALLLSSVKAQDVRAILERAVADFKAARIAESVRGFDEAVRLQPEAAPHLWQRGIALYYAGRHKDCRAMFESHRTVNPADVENSAWHFLCVARTASANDARRALLPVGPDSRAPMRQIYSMFRGELAPEAVIKAAGTDQTALFYAYLYTGLYSEALGKHTTEVRGKPRVIEAPGGKAIEFDGAGDALFVEVHPLAGASTFTWEVIFRPDRGGSREQRFFHLQTNDSGL